MDKRPDIEELWGLTTPVGTPFAPERLSPLPASARLYLAHAIVPGTPLAEAVRLRMHGAIKLGSWRKFEAEQVIDRRRGMIWNAAVRMGGLVIRGFDRLLDGKGAMRWKLFGLIPFLSASGPDITRSAAGRVIAELMWLPSALCAGDVSWTEAGALRPRANLTRFGAAADITFTIDETGRVLSLLLPRWGNPDKGAFREVVFGGFAEAERRFGGYTIPTQLRAGWYFGTPRFETDGEFFRVTIDDARYR